MLSGEETYTNFIVFDLTRPGLEPTIYRTRGKHAINVVHQQETCIRHDIVEKTTIVHNIFSYIVAVNFSGKDTKASTETRSVANKCTLGCIKYTLSPAGISLIALMVRH